MDVVRDTSIRNTHRSTKHRKRTQAASEHTPTPNTDIDTHKQQAHKHNAKTHDIEYINLSQTSRIFNHSIQKDFCDLYIDVGINQQDYNKEIRLRGLLHQLLCRQGHRLTKRMSSGTCRERLEMPVSRSRIGPCTLFILASNRKTFPRLLSLLA